MAHRLGDDDDDDDDDDDPGLMDALIDLQIARYG